MSAIGQSKTLVRTQIGWDQTQGRFEERTYQGTKNGMDSVSVVGAQSYSLDADSGLYTKTVRFADEVPTDEIRFEVHREHQSIYNIPSEAMVEELDAIEKFFLDFQTAPDVTNYTDAGKEVYYLASRRVTHKVVYHHSIIRTSTAGPTYGFVPDYTVTGRIISPVQAVLQKYVFGNAATPLPIKPPNFDDSLDVPATMDGYFEWGWLQHEPQYSFTSYNKVQFAVEWEYGLWAVTPLMYGDRIET